MLAAALAWGLFAFGGVYAWAYWPLVGAAFAIAALAVVAERVSEDARPAERWLAIGFGVFAAAAAVQLIPLPLAILQQATPETVRALQQLNPAVASGAVASHPLSIAPDSTVVGISLFAACAVLTLACSAIFSIRGGRGIARAITAIGVAAAITGIVQQPLYSGRIYGLWTPIDGGSPYGPFVNKNHFAGWMLMALPVTLGLFFGGMARAMRDVRRSWRDRLIWLSSAEASHLVLYAASALVMALALVLTMSRSGVAAFALSIAMTGAFVARRQRIGGRGAVAFAYLAFLVVVVVSWAGADVIASRFSETEWSELNARRGAWSDAIDIRARFPVAGTGLNTYGTATVLYQRHDLSRRYTEAHNDYLQLAAEGGWLLIVPALLSAVVFIVAVRHRFADETSVGAYWLRVGAVTGIAAIALQEAVEFSLQIPGNAILFAALCGIALHKAPPRHRTL